MERNEFDWYKRKKRQERIIYIVVSLLMLFTVHKCVSQSVPLHAFYVSGAIDILNSNPENGELDASTFRGQAGFNKYFKVDINTYIFFGPSIGFVSGHNYSDPSKSFTAALESGFLVDQNVAVSIRGYRYTGFKDWGIGTKAAFFLSPRNKMITGVAFFEVGLVQGTGYLSLGVDVPLNLDRK